MTNAESLKRFDVDLKKFAATIHVDLKKVVKRTAFNLFGKIVRRTPVDTGRARASWDMTEGAPSSFVRPPLMPGQKKKSKPEATQAALGNQLASISGEKPIFITNNVEYIGRLEYGSSSQAPHGMVAVSLAEVEAEMAGELADMGIHVE